MLSLNAKVKSATQSVSAALPSTCKINITVGSLHLSPVPPWWRVRKGGEAASYLSSAGTLSASV